MGPVDEEPARAHRRQPGERHRQPVRVGEAGRVRDLWAQLGNVLRRRASGWRLTLLSPDPALERQLQIPLRLVARTTNGGIPVRIVSGEVR